MDERTKPQQRTEGHDNASEVPKVPTFDEDATKDDLAFDDDSADLVRGGICLIRCMQR